MTPDPIFAAPAWRRRRCDGLTAALIIVMIAGLAATVLLHHASMLPTWLTILSGTLLMNLSFTAWHEPAHGNLSSMPALNKAAGVAASLASIYPGYYTRRREHLAHHRFEGDERFDPVHGRVQAGVFTFPIQLLRTIWTGETGQIPATFLPLTAPQRWSDRASNLLAFGVIAVAFAVGAGWSIVAGWVLPRVIVFWIHAYYICFFPHWIEHGGYRVYRVHPAGVVMRAFTVGQNYHGIHHLWPHLPWHQYGRVFRAIRDQSPAEIETGA